MAKEDPKKKKRAAPKGKMPDETEDQEEVLAEVPKDEDDLVKEALKKKQDDAGESADGKRRFRKTRDAQADEERLSSWNPITSVGRLVKEGKITDIDELLDSGQAILEAEIVDILLPNLEVDLLLVGQSKGKFGGGKRRIFRQTQKKTREGNKPQFLTYAVVGNRNGYVGVGYGKSKETVPAREKAIRRAKLNIIKIRRGTGSWEDNSKDPHSIPFKVTGKCGSSEMTLMPAPKGKGLVIESECAKVIALSGIKNVWSKTRGQTKTKMNLLNATFEALKKLSKVKVPHATAEMLNMIDGRMESNTPEVSADDVAEESAMPSKQKTQREAPKGAGAKE